MNLFIRTCGQASIALLLIIPLEIFSDHFWSGVSLLPLSHFILYIQNHQLNINLNTEYPWVEALKFYKSSFQEPNGLYLLNIYLSFLINGIFKEGVAVPTLFPQRCCLSNEETKVTYFDVNLF